ncbi:MAG: hypothetical protein ABSC06_30635 [Rhodopila sp.]|jgi:hypothetical protein
MTGVHPEFGKPWAASGESRPRHFRTPLAWVPGAGSGVLMVQDGSEPLERSWLLLSEWEAWVAGASAAPVEVPSVVRDARPSDDERQPWDNDVDDA